MTSIVFYFQVHQPYRVARMGHLDVGTGVHPLDDGLNEPVMQRVAERCYLSMNRLLLDLIKETKGAFRCAFSISGTALTQMEEWAPEALESFVELAKTGSVEFLCETSHHSLAALSDKAEFGAQVRSHRERIERLFGMRPTTFRDTELIFDDGIAKMVEDLGFDLLLGEGADRLLHGASPRVLRRPQGCSQIKLMLRDYPFSDDLAFRFSNREWECYPLMAETYAQWLHNSVPAGQEADHPFVGLFMDYETFGEHQWAETGIFDFMRAFPKLLLEDSRFDFSTPAEVAKKLDPVETISATDPISWADAERDVTAWLGNPMQREANAALYALLPRALEADAAGHADLLEDWRRLSTSDHVYYMSTKHMSDQDVHEYFSPYESPHQAYVFFTNVLDDLELRIEAALSPTTSSSAPSRQDSR
ncbi:MAG: alpha-amylase [Planctomycetota bacterium]